MTHDSARWDATLYFRALTASNRLAREKGFRFRSVSGLDGFEQAIASVQSRTPLVCVSDQSDGYTELTDTPHTRHVKTVFLCAPHRLDDMEARNCAMNTLRELFRQFLSHLIRQRTLLAQGGIYLDQRIAFSEIESNFLASGACAFFQITYDIYTDLRFRPEEWDVTEQSELYG